LQKLENTLGKEEPKPSIDKGWAVGQFKKYLEFWD
jgi:hypothetical protein